MVSLLAILVGLMGPRFAVVIERGRQEEAINFLAHAHGSMLRYYYENNETWPDANGDLDIEIPTLKYFDTFSLTDAYTDPFLGPGCAFLRRIDSRWGAYVVRVDGNGNFSYLPTAETPGGPGGLPK